MPRPPASALVVALLLLGGCVADPGAPVARETSRTPAAAADGAQPTAPSDSPSPSRRPRPARPLRAQAERRVLTPQAARPAADPSVDLRPFSTADEALLSVRDLGRGWRVHSTGAERGRLVSRCQRVPLVDIGALSSRVRRLGSTHARVAQAVGVFADRKSAWRSDRVLDAWGDDCGRELASRGAALGSVRVGHRVSLVEVTGVRRPERRLTRLLDTVRTRLG